MKIQAINFNNSNKKIQNSKSINFKNYHNNYIKAFDKLAYTKLGEGFSSSHNKSVVMDTYTSLINLLKQFPAKCRTPLFDKIFNDPKYMASPFALIKDLHEGTGSIACQALSVEASKYHQCYETPYHYSYPLVTNDKDNKACLVLARCDLNPISKGIRFLLGREEEKNGFYRLIFINDFHHRIDYDLTDSGHFFFCNPSEDASYNFHLRYKAHEFHRDFKHYRSYSY